MGNAENLLFRLLDFLYNIIHHLHQRFVDSPCLIQLADGSFRCGAHHRFDLQRRRDKRFQIGKAAVLSQRLQIFQNEIGVLTVNILFHRVDQLAKRHSCLLTFNDLLHDQCLAHRRASGVKHMDLLCTVFLQCQSSSQHRAIVGTAQFRRESHRILVLLFSFKRLLIYLRGRARRFRAFRTRRHFCQKRLLIKSLIVNDLLLPHFQSQRCCENSLISFHFFCQFAAAVCNNLIGHTITSKITLYLRLNR